MVLRSRKEMESSSHQSSRLDTMIFLSSKKRTETSFFSYVKRLFTYLAVLSILLISKCSGPTETLASSTSRGKTQIRVSLNANKLKLYMDGMFQYFHPMELTAVIHFFQKQPKILNANMLVSCLLAKHQL